MNKKLKFKGSMKRFMRWPLYLTILLVLLNVLIFTVNVKAGLLSLAGLVIYVAAALLLTHYHRPMILNDLIAFANSMNRWRSACWTIWHFPMPLWTPMAG